MTRSRKSADRSRRLVGGLAIALALAWSVSAHLLWQVESRQEKDPSPAVRLVLSALEPSAPLNRTSTDKTSKETPRSVTQPVQQDGEAPAPCRMRRSFSIDVDVLASIQLLTCSALPEEPVRPDLQPRAIPWSADVASEKQAFCEGPPGRFSRPPPVRS